MAIQLMGTSILDDADLLDSIDRGVETPRGENERVWILDPIDGTKGLITGKQYIVGLALTVEGKAVVAVMGNPGVYPEVMVAVKGHGLRYWSAKGESCIDLPRSIPNNWNLKRYDFSKLIPGSGVADFGWGSGSDISGVDYPPFLLSRPMTGGSPLPFGPLCAPTEICCGAQVKYFAVARGDVAGFIQFQSSLKSWDHAPGVLCVQESGGIALDAAGNDIVFAGREFTVEKGIVCCAAESDTMTRQRLMACVQETVVSG
jgi:3'(2'), 5'-bisphosphate nucleotidase